MKKIVVITNFMSVALQHKAVLEALFEQHVEVSCYALDQDKIDSEIDADLLLISIYPIYVNIKDFVQATTKVIVLGSTLTETQFLRIREIPTGSRVLLVNYSPEMTVETLALFRQLGLTDYDFISYYPGKMNLPEVDLAVTPGEAALVPSFVKKVIDLGHRTLDIRTLIDVAVELGLESLLDEKRFLDHFRSLKSPSSSATMLLDRANISEDRFLKLMDVIDEGLLVTSNLGIVLTMNRKALELLRKEDALIGVNLVDILPVTIEDLSRSVEPKLIQVSGGLLSLKAYPVISKDQMVSILIILNRFEDQERSQHLLRKQILGKGHLAKYHFDDIICVSDVMNKWVAIAKKMARSEANVFITGESGTGKELFAQAMHNASQRRDHPFVAINCAAIPESLLESELFGYEEGAFSGAKRGGKVGLFELAHKGTLFLDEIGEMPTLLQSRLLRVVQEKEVMRVGGDRVIPIDVRIIAATNRQTEVLIETGQFRLDLYYRLNVLHLGLPPLRERIEDLPLLIETMKSAIGATYDLSYEVHQALKDHPWEGNLRELRNVVEYLAYLEKAFIDVVDLPQQFHRISQNTPSRFLDPSNSVDLIEQDLRQFVLGALREAELNQQGLGRQRIAELARLNGHFITEGEVRKLLAALVQEGLVISEQSRKGSRLTPKGRMIFTK